MIPGKNITFQGEEFGGNQDIYESSFRGHPLSRNQLKISKLYWVAAEANSSHAGHPVVYRQAVASSHGNYQPEQADVEMV
jgi:hypothetical protein